MVGYIDTIKHQDSWFDQVMGYFRKIMLWIGPVSQVIVVYGEVFCDFGTYE